MRKAILVMLLCSAQPLLAQKAPEGIWQGYDGEWKHVSSQLVALAEATPEDKFSWRPAPGVRSTSEVYMHIVFANFYLLSVTGPKMPSDLKRGMDKTVTAKADVINWLKGCYPIRAEGMGGRQVLCFFRRCRKLFLFEQEISVFRVSRRHRVCHRADRLDVEQRVVGTRGAPRGRRRSRLRP